MTKEHMDAFASDAAATPLPTEAEALALLASAARDGQSGAFDLLARRLERRLMAFALRAIGDRSLAEEAVQEALVRMYRAIGRFQDGNVAGWAFAILQRTCCDVTRKERRGTRTELTDAAAADDPIEAADIRAAIDAALARLPEHLRDTFLLNQQGLPYEDVAAILSVPVGTVRSRLHEARSRLRDMLAASLGRENVR